MARLSVPLLVLLVLAGSARAQDGVTVVLRPGLAPAGVSALLDAARATGRPVTIRWEDAAAVPAARPPPVPAPVAADPTSVPGLALAFETGFAARLARLSHVGDLLDDAARRWGANANGATGPVLARLAAILALAILAGLLVRAGLGALGRRYPGHVPAGEPDLVDRVRHGLRGLGADLLAVGAVLTVGQLALARLLPATDLARTLAAGLVQALVVFALYAAAGRFLIAPGRPADRILPLPRPAWHYRMLLVYAALGQAVTLSVALAQAVGGEPLTVEAWFLVAASVITVQKVWWFWVGRRDIAAALLPTIHPDQPRPNLLRRGAAHALPWLLVAVAVLIWAAGNVTAAAPEMGLHWGRAAGATQIVVAVLPILALGIGALARAFVVRHHALDAATPARLALAATARTLIAGGVWVLGLVVVARIWDAFLRDPASLAAVRGAVRIGVALVAGWAIWSFLHAYFDAHTPRARGALPRGDDEAEPLVQSRLATVLPIVRGLVLGAVVAVTSLVVLSSVGIDIAPLLAGFGVVGLAISFGSQALVRDVVSGIFFMADDAFRVGEYVDTGRLKGTVEKITLRSVQLRHQNGQIHTVPFGQLQAITNFSRDWATIKFAIRLDRETDIERARKAIKRVGQEMLDDPELGPEFIQPLKMQGVQEIADAAIVVRCKFTSTPVKPSTLQREALKRIHRALLDAGVAFASNAVTVRGGGEPREAAALAVVPPAPLQGAA